MEERRIRRTPGNLSSYYTSGDFTTGGRVGNQHSGISSSSVSSNHNLTSPALSDSGIIATAADEDDIIQDTVTTCPYGCCKTESTSEYIFKRGFLEGAYSDVIIRAFGNTYRLHRLFLDKSDYFRSLFSWTKRQEDQADEEDEEDEKDDNRNRNEENKEGDPKDTSIDSQSDRSNSRKGRLPEYGLKFDGDPRYTQASFELAIARLYGAINIKEENKIPYNMIAIGQYLAISEVVCTATDYIVRHTDMSNISENLRFATLNNYGSASERIIQNGKGILCTDGWECGPDKWDGIPVCVIAEVVGKDYFFVPTEWDRCIFIIKLLERRLASKIDDEESVKPLKEVLNTKIHYCHLPPEQLQELELLYDINGDHYIDPQVLHNALWKAVQIQRMVLTAPDSPQLENIVTSPVEPTSECPWYKVPGKDDTTSGLPAELDDMLYSSNPGVCNHGTARGQEDGKSTQGHQYPTREEKLYNWTRIPSFRFSVSFANVSDLVTDKRVYAKTFWYAGSYWNLYLQKNHIPSKSTYQVGVYLHRANSSSPTPSPKNGLINPDIYVDNPNYQSMPTRYGRGDRVDEMRYPRRSMASSASSTLQISALDQTELKENVTDESLTSFSELSISDSHHPSRIRNVNQAQKVVGGIGSSLPNYEDHRSSIRVYFVIFTPSRRLKPTITSFLSVPNDFSKSQSWGWKSNSMCVFNEDGTFPQGHNPHLKFMIVLGNV
ncbi:DEKNAAC100125 [Brettanomyces naardenensis]|uniref:DEKNAAC100125 n=1 Tax=Brettanomyces naardenensis TaxID=13370 RepID=A0A448YGA4_BRENA|nr:DEKNAAC100125 [Brettanomyces naardenensis]